jgi:hypothetical protein
MRQWGPHPFYALKGCSCRECLPLGGGNRQQHRGCNRGVAAFHGLGQPLPHVFRRATVIFSFFTSSTTAAAAPTTIATAAAAAATTTTNTTAISSGG